MDFTRREFLLTTGTSLMLPALNTWAADKKTDEPEWSFAVYPDTQWKTNMEAPYHGTAIHIIDAMNTEVIRQKVDFVLEVGDLVQEPSPDAFRTRAKHNAALRQAGIGFYPVRGNHDGRVAQDTYDFRKAFPELPGNPGRGGNSPALPNAAGLTYSYTHKGGKFILLDTFPIADDGSETGRAYTIRDYLPWMESELSKNDYRFAMVFAHKNLLGQNHKDNVFNDTKTDQDAPVEVQDAFFALLQKYKVRYYLCGHDHMYHRSNVKSPNGHAEVCQIICGSAAHKFYTPQAPFLSRETPIAQELNRVGFLIIRVKPNRLVFEYYSTEPFGTQPAEPIWELRDLFGRTFDGREFENPNPKLRRFVRPDTEETDNHGGVKPDMISETKNPLSPETVPLRYVRRLGLPVVQP
ncbi:MAG: metallophosphoesterase [Planctomycetaceae bacterium]|jgi:hypothetical protein|nr:metallophosphoesterase [Planctomycetaceae bacterium]